MAQQQWNPFPGRMLPALPPPRLTADMYETPGGDAFVLEIPVPGLEQEEITIEATSDSLTVVTRPRDGTDAAGRRYLQQEQVLKPMSRVFEFPAEIDTDGIRAKLEYGVLKISAPRAGAGRRREISVR